MFKPSRSLAILAAGIGLIASAPGAAMALQDRGAMTIERSIAPRRNRAKKASGRKLSIWDVADAGGVKARSTGTHKQNRRKALKARGRK